MAISRQVAHSFKVIDAAIAPSSDLFHIGSGWRAIGVLYSASKTIFFRVMTVSIVLFIFTYELVIPWTHLLPNRTFQTAVIWYLLAGSFAFVFLTRLSQSFLDGLGYMYLGRVISGVYQIICTIFSILALRLNFGLIGLAFVLLTASLIQLLAMHVSLRLVSSGRLVADHSGSRPLVGKLWRVSLPFGLVNTGVYLVGAAQVPLLGALLGPGVVAPIYIALKISQVLNSTVLQIVTAQLPFFTQQCAQGHWRQARERMFNVLLVGGALQVMAALCIYFASPKLVDWWVGPGHYINGLVLLIFSLNYAVTCLVGLPAQFVLASGRNPFALSTLLHGVLTLGGMAILCPMTGLLGAPLAGLVAVLLTNGWLNPVEAWHTWRNISRLGQAATPL